MVTLNGIELPGLVWENRLDWTGMIAEVEYSLAKVPIIWEEVLNTGRPIDLVGKETVGAQKLSTLESVLSLASVVGGTYELQYNDKIRLVRFRNEDPPVIAGEPLIGREKSQGTDYYKNVVIKLMEVS